MIFKTFSGRFSCFERRYDENGDCTWLDVYNM